MRAEVMRALRAFTLVAACLGVACAPTPGGTSRPVTEWDCPSIDCATLEGSAVCSGGVCVNEPTPDNVRALVRLPTNTSVAPGMFLLATPLESASCEGCVSRPTSYRTEQGVLLSRDAARIAGFVDTNEVVVPARVTLEPLVDGAYAMNAVLPRPLALTTLDRWPRALASTSWRGPRGEAPEPARAVLFEGRYARRIEPDSPYDERVPPVIDTLTLPGGAQMYALGAAQLVAVTIERLVLPTRAAGWSVYLVDAKGERRSTRARFTASDGPVVLRIDASQTPDPLVLDLVVAPNDPSLAAPRLVVPAPTALRRIAYPSFAGSSRVNVRVLDASGKGVAGAHVAFTLRALEAAPGSDAEIFAAYARAQASVVTNDAGVAVVQAPFGAYDALARTAVDGGLQGTRTLTHTLASDSTSLTFRPTATRALSGVCAFVGGKLLAGAELEAQATDAATLPSSLARVSVITDASGAFRFELPEGAFAFWLHPPPGAPMGDQFLGRDASAATRLGQLDCRLRASARRTLTILDGLPQASAPVPLAIVETLRLRPGLAPLWLGEGISRSDGRVDIYEAP